MHDFASPHPVVVVKFGGNAMTPEATAILVAEVGALHREGARVVLVHGGGPEIDRELAARSIATQRVEGMRVTDLATLTVVESVLCGTINKSLVRACLAAGLPAVGISGEDGALLVAVQSATALGYVGDVIDVRAMVLTALLNAGCIPVVAPLGVAGDGSTAYNVNGDTAAGAIAGALQADLFVLVTNVSQVRRDPDDPATGIAHLSPDEARAFATSAACRDSMRPKMQAAVAAIDAGARRAIISSTLTEALHQPGHTTVLEWM